MIAWGCSNSLSSTSKSGNYPLNGGQNGMTIGALDTLWTVVSNSKLTEKQKGRLSKINARYKDKRGSLKLRTQDFAQVNKNVLSILQKEHKIALPLSADSTVVAVRKRLRKPNGENGNTYWEGPLLNLDGKLWVTLSIDQKGHIGGGIELPPASLTDYNVSSSTTFLSIGDGLVVIQYRERGGR